MFGHPRAPREQILRLPQSPVSSSPLRMCTSQELPRDHQNCPHTRPQPRQKISIKQLLKKRTPNTLSYSSMSQVSGPQSREGPPAMHQATRRDMVGYMRSPQHVPAVQNNNAVNFIFGECVIKPQQVRIFYHNSPRAKELSPHYSNQINFNYPPIINPVAKPPKIETDTLPHSSPCLPVQSLPVSSPVPEKKEIEKEREKSEPFNQFMSFGPKNLELFKTISGLDINEITSHIIEQTERTELDEQSQTDPRRLTKTFSEAKIRHERDGRKERVSQLQGRSPFARSNMFRSIKHTETMGGKDDSDHESEVVEKFESLMQKVRENRLDTSIIEI